jgi:large subunit ribosomal protein L1
MKRGKKYTEAAKLIDRAAQYDTEEAISLVKKAAVAKFDETIECHIRTVVMDVMQISRSVVL